MKPSSVLSRTAFLSLLGGVLGALLFGVSPALAQTTVSTFTVPVKGVLLPQDTGLKESVSFKGTVAVTTTVVTDPTGALPPSVLVQINGVNTITATGSNTGAAYSNECEANLTRLFKATDTINLTFAFFRDPNVVSNALFSSATAVLSLNLTYSTTTTALTSASGSIVSIKTQAL
jgi:hypothetical protein